MTDNTEHKPGCEALGGYGHGIAPCSCSEAQPEALRLADALAQAGRAEAAAISYGEGTTLGIEAYASAKTIRAQHAEIQQLKAQLSARQAAPDGWRLVPVDPTEEMLDAAHEGDRQYTLRVFGDVMTVMQGPHDHYVAMLSAAPPPPEREPLTLAQIDGIGDATGKPSHTWHYEFARAIERAHGIGATNDNP